MRMVGEYPSNHHYHRHHHAAAGLSARGVGTTSVPETDEHSVRSIEEIMQEVAEGGLN